MHLHSPSACCQPKTKYSSLYYPNGIEYIESAYVQLNLFAFQINDCYFYLDENELKKNLYAYYDERMTCCFYFISKFLILKLVQTAGMKNTL